MIRAMAPAIKFLRWFVVPFLLLLSAAWRFAENRPPADLDVRRTFASAFQQLLIKSLPRPETTRAIFVRPESVISRSGKYHWEERTFGQNKAGEHVSWRITCEGSPKNPKIQLMESSFGMAFFALEDSSQMAVR